jgi:enoyl-CoA hydratase/carnithine racemase
MSTGPPFTDIELTVSDGIATIALNRPERMNAFTLRMGRELVAAFDVTDADDEVTAVVLTGQGPAFCAGMELGDKGNDSVTGLTKPPANSFRDPGGVVTLRIFESSKPVIAAINGSAVGIGLTMTLPADIRLVAEDTKLGLVFGARGLVPDGASSWFLPRVVGLPKALEWCLTARVFTPDEALAAGLVSSVHPAEEVLPTAHSLARTISEQIAATSATLTRQLLWRMSSLDGPVEAHRLESRALQFAFATPDFEEGVAAFLDRRPAR